MAVAGFSEGNAAHLAGEFEGVHGGSIVFEIGVG